MTEARRCLENVVLGEHLDIRERKRMEKLPDEKLHKLHYFYNNY
jgi:hypothetical protein